MNTANRFLLAALAALVAAPVTSADHWAQDTGGAKFGDSTCYWATLTSGDPGCHVAYACNGGSPPQIVDTALYCSARLAGEAEAVARSAPFYAWTVADWAGQNYEPVLGAPHDALQPTLDVANAPLCDVVWSFFCTTPIVLPDDAPVDDPIQQYPLPWL
jgi:hypothetical protein